MNELPKKWCIKGGEELKSSDFKNWNRNPSKLTGNVVGTFYLFDGEKIIDYISTPSFEEYPLISFEEFSENFLQIPEKWYIKYTLENADILTLWRGPCSKTIFYSILLSTREECYFTNIPEHYTEITFEQFEKYVLHKEEISQQIDSFRIRGTKLPNFKNLSYRCLGWSKETPTRVSEFGFENLISFGYNFINSECWILAEKPDYDGKNYYMFKESDLLEGSKKFFGKKKIIGYKLKAENFKQVVYELLFAYSFNFKEFETKAYLYPTVVKRLQRLNILDLWFEPVYEELKPVYKMDGYKAEFEEHSGVVTFGCQEYDPGEVKTLIDAIYILDKINRDASLTVKGLSLSNGDTLKLAQLREILNLIK